MVDLNKQKTDVLISATCTLLTTIWMFVPISSTGGTPYILFLVQFKWFHVHYVICNDGGGAKGLNN